METKNIDRIAKLSVIHKSFARNAEYYRKKLERARNSEIRNGHYEKYSLYSDLCRRCQLLYSSLEYPKKFGWGRHFWEQNAEEYKKSRLEYKRARKENFDSSIKVHLHFFQNSFGADYGTYTCDRCNGQFHHSPSTVYRGKIKQHSSCCGHCVNSLLERNGQEPIFQ